jgi:prepilin-type processing-associated H-X9-DG protein
VPTALQYVPHDAAFFIYADVAGIWTSDLVKTFRAADKKSLDRLAEAVKEFGVPIDELKSVVLFVPKLKGPQDTERLGVAFTFTKAFDKKALEAGAAKLLPKNAKFTVLAPEEKVALVLVGLGEEHGKPQPADGPLTAAIRAAAGGKHALVAGATLGNLPDELRSDVLPRQVQVLRPLFHSEAVSAAITLGKTLDLDVRVKTKREAQAVDAEKALAALVTLITDELGRELPDLEKEADKDAGLKDLVKVFKASLDAAKAAKFAVDGTEARLTASLPLNGLPLVSAYLTATTRVTGAAAAQQSANNLKQIALALHNYHDAIGTFPPAAVCDKKGKPQLSWRVLILPYIEQNELYKQFKLDEPWDSEHNKKLIAKMPPVYAIPGKSKPGDTDTYYRVFVGNDAGFDWVMGGKIVGITDGTSNTIMVVTAAEAVPWTKPDELEFDPEKDMTKLIGMVVNGRAQVAMFDGSVRTLNKLPSKATLHALITKNGGEVIGNDF